MGLRFLASQSRRVIEVRVTVIGGDFVPFSNLLGLRSENTYLFRRNNKRSVVIVNTALFVR